LALIAVAIVLLVFTGNITVSIFVLVCVGLTDLFLFGLCAFWNVTLNSVSIINVVIAIGLAVDYSAHIAHAYLTIDPPSADEKGNQLTNH
jgi:Niemann-Pick C1 protein